jgi:RNA polymerase sigma factor (sigma-70 family)
MSIQSLDSIALYDACRSQDLYLQSSAYEALWKYLYSRILYLLGSQPNAEKVAEDCCQDALIRIHERLGEVRESIAFLGWARRIAINLAKDELKKRKRLSSLDDIEQSIASADFIEYDRNNEDELSRLINLAPISSLSRRVVIGRYLNDQLDEELAALESTDEINRVLPSHIQVTRSKNIAKLRTWPILLEYLTGSVRT